MGNIELWTQAGLDIRAHIRRMYEANFWQIYDLTANF